MLRAVVDVKMGPLKGAEFHVGFVRIVFNVNRRSESEKSTVKVVTPSTSPTVSTPGPTMKVGGTKVAPLYAVDVFG
jgi:hypothetical protein